MSALEPSIFYALERSFFSTMPPFPICPWRCASLYQTHTSQSRDPIRPNAPIVSSPLAHMSPYPLFQTSTLRTPLSSRRGSCNLCYQVRCFWLKRLPNSFSLSTSYSAKGSLCRLDTPYWAMIYLDYGNGRPWISSCHGPWNTLADRSPDGRALLVNYKRGTVLHHFNFQKPVKALSFSPDGRLVVCSAFLISFTSPQSLPGTLPYLMTLTCKCGGRQIILSESLPHSTFTGHTLDIMTRS